MWETCWFICHVCFLLLKISSFSLSVQVRCLGTTTPLSSLAARWWTSAAMSLSSMSARHLWAVMGRGRTMLLGALFRKRPMRQPHFSRAVWDHKGTPFPTAPCQKRHCQSRKWWRSDHGESENWLMAVYLSVHDGRKVTSKHFCWLLHFRFLSSQ